MGAFADHENRDRMRQLRSALLTKMKTEKCALTAPPAGYEPRSKQRTEAEANVVAGDLNGSRVPNRGRKALETLFAQFALLGTIGAVVRYFRSHQLLVPCRVMSGQDYGQVELRPPTYWRIRCILINPHYTDALVFARRDGKRRAYVDRESPRPQRVQRPVNEWQVVREHHEGYVSWDTFWTQHHLQENLNKLRSAPRGGSAVLSRLSTAAVVAIP